MRLNCTIDEIPYSLIVNVDKPLSKILEDELDTFAINNECLGARCGNCVVLVDNVCVLSCLVPAFKINRSSILTYEGFSKTQLCHDIERAYAELGTKPCKQCYASKTLLIASLVEKANNTYKTRQINDIKTKIKNMSEFNKTFIAKEIGLNCCKCMEISTVEKIIKLTYQFGRKRNEK